MKEMARVKKQKAALSVPSTANPQHAANTEDAPMYLYRKGPQWLLFQIVCAVSGFALGLATIVALGYAWLAFVGAVKGYPVRPGSGLGWILLPIGGAIGGAVAGLLSADLIYKWTKRD